MTRTGRTLTEYLKMGAAGKAALISFINYLPPDSALYRAMNPKDELATWSTPAKTNAILADLFDLVMVVNTKKGVKPTEYPRPVKKRTFGRGAVSIDEFWNFWNSKGEKKWQQKEQKSRGLMSP